MPAVNSAGSTRGAPGSYTLDGPPDRISAAGLRATISSTGVSPGTISENTWASRTRRAISWAYWAPKSTTRTVGGCTRPIYADRESRSGPVSRQRRPRAEAVERTPTFVSRSAPDQRSCSRRRDPPPLRTRRRVPGPARRPPVTIRVAPHTGASAARWTSRRGSLSRMDPGEGGHPRTLDLATGGAAPVSSEAAGDGAAAGSVSGYAGGWRRPRRDARRRRFGAQRLDRPGHPAGLGRARPG